VAPDVIQMFAIVNINSTSTVPAESAQLTQEFKVMAEAVLQMYVQPVRSSRRTVTVDIVPHRTRLLEMEEPVSSNNKPKTQII